MMSFLRPLLAPALLAAALAATGCNTPLTARLPNSVARIQGYKAYSRGDITTARDFFAHAINQRGSDWKSHYYLGLIGLNHLHDPGFARRHLEMAYTIRVLGSDDQRGPGEPAITRPWPTRNQIIDALAEAMYRQDNQPQLVAFLRQVIDERGQPADYIRLGRYLYKSGDPDGALTAYRKAVAIAGPENPNPYIALADFYDTLGKRDEAATALRRAYDIAPLRDDIARKLRAHGLRPSPTIALPRQ